MTHVIYTNSKINTKTCTKINTTCCHAYTCRGEAAVVADEVSAGEAAGDRRWRAAGDRDRRRRAVGGGMWPPLTLDRPVSSSCSFPAGGLGVGAPEEAGVCVRPAWRRRARGGKAAAGEEAAGEAAGEEGEAAGEAAGEAVSGWGSWQGSSPGDRKSTRLNSSHPV